MKFQIFIGIVLFFFSAHVFAKCEKGTKTIFSCKVKKSGKLLEVCDANKNIQYSFGKPNKKPELSLSIPRNKASTYQWNGIGSHYNYSVFIPNDKVVYEVFWSANRMSEEHEISAGVLVNKKEKILATIYCINKTIINNMEGVTLKPVDP